MSGKARGRLWKGIALFSPEEWLVILLMGAGSALVNHYLIGLLVTQMGDTVLERPFGIPILVTRFSTLSVPADLLLSWTGYGAVAVALVVRRTGAPFIAMSINGMVQVLNGSHLPHLMYGFKGLGAELVILVNVASILTPPGYLVAGGLAEVFWFAVRGHSPLAELGSAFIALRLLLRFVGGALFNGLSGVILAGLILKAFPSLVRKT